MRKIRLGALSALILLFTGTAFADGHEGDGWTFTPVDTWTCEYNDDKGGSDLDKVVEKWNKWADKNDYTSSFAITVTPWYFGEDVFDVGWLEVWPNGNAFGKDAQTWLEKGSEIGGEFGEVIDCPTHSNFATTRFKAPPADTAPDKFILTFSDCTINEGTTPDALREGFSAWGAHQEERGYRNGLWLMFPVYGAGGAEFDFKMVESYDNYNDFGAAYEMMGNGGDWAVNGQLTGELVSCDESRVYDATVRRRPKSEE